jgi:hypothetical protein
VDREPAGELKWQKGRSCDMGQCVEIAADGKEVLVRSSVSPHVLLALSRGEWRDFLTDAKEGLFDQVLGADRSSRLQILEGRLLQLDPDSTRGVAPERGPAWPRSRERSRCPAALARCEWAPRGPTPAARSRFASYSST